METNENLGHLHAKAMKVAQKALLAQEAGDLKKAKDFF